MELPKRGKVKVYAFSFGEAAGKILNYGTTIFYDE